MNEIPPERPVQHRIFDRFSVVAVVLTLLAFAMSQVKIDEVNGIPSHPLFVHIPVVLLPLAAIAALPIAWYPAWRRRYLPPVIIVAIIALAGSIVSVNAGEALRDAMNGGGDTIADHAKAGHNVPWAALALVVTLFGLRLANRYRAVGKFAWAVPVIGVLTTLASLFSIGAVVYAGDLGSKAVWEDQTTSSSGHQEGKASDDGFDY